MDKRLVIVRILIDRFPLGAGSVALGLFFIFSAVTARANVYATDIRLNGSLNAGVIVPGSGLTISYILNDAASAGVWVRIYSGTNLIQTLASTNGNAGTNLGLNSVIWNGTSNLAEGVYTVNITAASAGYETWTNITDDGTNFSVEAPRGVSVNQNTNSPFYGRVYVGNAAPKDQGGNPGIIKCNADGSPADEGGFSTGDYDWQGEDDVSPWKMAVGADDRLYVDDYSGQGVVVSFDPTIAPDNWLQVIRMDNYPAGDPLPYLTGLAIVGEGTNAEIWMTDASLDGSSAGIIEWQIGAGGVAATNDTGTVIVPVGPYYLTEAPFDLALDTNGFIYTIQLLASNSNPAYALMSFPPYDGEQETTADWAVAMYPTLLEAYGVAVDPTATFVSVAVVGECDTESGCGGIYLFSAADGEYITNLNKADTHPYYDVAWDNVGNLYALDGVAEVWRAYSPPGTNHATTVAVPIIQAYNALLGPSLVNPAISMGGLGFTLEGQSNVTYIVQSSSDLTNWVAATTNYSVLANRTISVPVTGGQAFYRAMTIR